MLGLSGRTVILALLCVVAAGGLLAVGGPETYPVAKHEDTLLADGAPTGSLRIATFNIQHGRGLDGTVDLQRIADVVTSHEVDVVLLNEVDRNWFRSGRQDQATRLGELSGARYVAFAPALRLFPWLGAAAPTYGNAVVSHLAWSSVEVVDLPRHGRNEPRNVVVVTFPLETPNRSLTVFSTHLSTQRAERMAQIDYILDHFRLTDEPMILVGDFNSQPHQEDVQRLVAAGWVDLWPLFGTGSGATFPSGEPKNRIDYMFASPGAVGAVRSIVVVQTEASDHLPVLLELDVTRL